VNVGAVADELMARLLPSNPYVGFPYQDYLLDLQNTPEQPAIGQVLTQLRPRVVVEAGTWKGDSAIRMATILAGLQVDAAIVCVDTWLGSLEHLAGTIPGWDIRPYLKHGYPTLYHQFLANAMHRGCQDRIVPIANSTTNGARWLLRQQVVADMVYLDASHEEDDVYQDLLLYWKLLRPGGVICGDDWHAFWYGVICAVGRFAKERDLRLQVANQTWVLQKPT
jgi:predicted O-methyltransferase YrrM